GARTAPGASSFGPTAPRAMAPGPTAIARCSGAATGRLRRGVAPPRARAVAAGPTAFARSFAAVTERLAGVLSVRRARAEKSLAARLPSRILAPVTELLTRRAPEMSCSARWAAAGPPRATNRAADDRTSEGDGRCITTS